MSRFSAPGSCTSEKGLGPKPSTGEPPCSNVSGTADASKPVCSRAVCFDQGSSLVERSWAEFSGAAPGWAECGNAVLIAAGSTIHGTTAPLPGELNGTPADCRS